MGMKLRIAITALALTAAPLAQAHPHVFVDTTLHVVVEEGRATRVDVTWVWDDFFTLLIFEDMGLDPDGDAVLNKAELARLRGFDFEVWPPGFEGDLYAYSHGEKLALGHPQVTGIAVENGRIVSSHSRSLPDVAADGLELRQYDPTYYVAYSLRGPVTVTGPCAVEVAPHDPEDAARAIDKELNRVPEDMFEQLMVGEHYADTVKIACNGSS